MRHRWPIEDQLEQAELDAAAVEAAVPSVQLLDHQQPPTGPWRLWLLLGGRGSGKTTAGAAWLLRDRPPHARLGVIAPTSSDARDVCLEGPAGIIALLEIQRIPHTYNRSLGEVILGDGGRIKVYSADEPNRLRGPQNHRIWGDEIASWRYGEQALDMALFGLRLGDNPQGVFTTTPRPVVAVKRLLAEAVVQHATTYDNTHLPAAFRDEILARYAGTRIGRQEIDAQLLDDVPGALWTRAQLDADRVTAAPDLRRVVVGVDPSTTAGGDACGIVVAAKDAAGHAFILDDRTLQGSPSQWAHEAVATYHRHGADRLIAESNQGGEMVRLTIQTVSDAPSVTLVHASRGKLTRAEPIAALYEQHRVHHVGTFADLEDELCSYDGTGDSPNRLDACVWALTALGLTGGTGVYL